MKKHASDLNKVEHSWGKLEFKNGEFQVTIYPRNWLQKIVSRFRSL